VKARIGLLIVAILVALASCEIAARIVFPAPPDPTRQPQIVFRYDPDLKYIPVENQRGWVDDGFVTTNSLGFRGPEIATPKPSGRFRVVALGDSVTFGFGVNDTETFCAQAEQILRRSLNGRDVELVNLAVPGYDTLQEVGLIKRTAALLQPDLVLLGFYTNDVPDALAEKESSGGGTTIAAANPVKGQVLHMNPTPTSWLEAQLRRSRAIYTGGHALKALVRRGEGKAGSSLELDLLENHRSADLERAWERVDGQLSELRTIATAGNFKVGIIILPPREQVSGQFVDSQYQPHLRAMADKLGFFVVDPLPAMSASPMRKDRLFIPYDRNHPSAAGHRIIGETIATFLNQHGEAAGLPRQLASSAR